MQHPDLEQILAELKDYIDLAYASQVDQILLFGSQARGDAQPGSDIDVLVVLKGGAENFDPYAEIARTNPFIADLGLKYSVLVNCVFVSSAEYEAKKNAYFYRNVHREGVTL